MVQHLRKSITALIFFLACPAAGAQAPSAPLVLKPDAPDRYVIVPGDTLWGISTRYTDSPWRWPGLWGMNREQIRNPHLIYPGMVLVLDRARGTLRRGLQSGGPAQEPTPTEPGTGTGTGPTPGRHLGAGKLAARARRIPGRR